MREFESRHKSQSFFFLLRAGAALVLVAVSVFAMRAAWDMYGRFKLASQEHQDTQKQRDSLEARQQEVGAAVGTLTTPRGIEAEIRERYGVAKPGEGEITIVRDATSQEGTVPPSQDNLLARIIRTFFPW